MAFAASLSIVDFIHELRLAGVSDQVSEVYARQFEQTTAEFTQVINKAKEEVQQNIKQEIQIESLATKEDLSITKKELELAIEKLRTEIHQIRYDMLKFTVWTGVSIVVALGGMLAKGFHWF